MSEKECLVHWTATVYGTYGAYAETEDLAADEAKKNVIPTRDGDDYTGPIQIDFVEVLRELNPDE